MRGLDAEQVCYPGQVLRSRLLWASRATTDFLSLLFMETRALASFSSRENAQPGQSTLDLVNLTALMERTAGRPEVKIGLIDGPVAIQHPDLAGAHLHEISGRSISAACAQANSTACLHGTFVAGILFARRNSQAPAICPACTLVVRPIFTEMTSGREQMPSATPNELAAAIIECIDDGARVINLSLALAQSSTNGELSLAEALSRAVRGGVIVVAAAGNQGTIGSSAITNHPWVIPVVACDKRGRPTNESNLGSSIGRRGLSAPGEGITSLGAAGQSLTLGGTSVAAPFVTGATALLWSAFPSATAAQIKFAITASTSRRTSVVPPLLDAAAAYQRMLTQHASQ
jgi:subtilisin family serine protease